MYVKKEKKREIKDRILLQSISPESLVYLFNYGKQLTRPRLSLIFHARSQFAEEDPGCPDERMMERRKGESFPFPIIYFPFLHKLQCFKRMRPVLRKGVTAHLQNYDNCLGVFDIANQLLTCHSSYASLCQNE